MKLILSLFFLAVCSGRGFRSFLNIEAEPTRYFEQALDHFNPQDSRIWKQRYFLRDEFIDRKKVGKSPVFLCVGGEGPPLDSSVVYERDSNVHCSLMVHHAKKVGALILALEHRFYGQSTPTENLSIENLRYLSSEQALADLAMFQNYISSKYNLEAGKNKWITFGGSYPGMMASFARVKYPHLIFGSVASSAPVKAVFNYNKFYAIVKKSMQNEYVGGSVAFQNKVSDGFKDLGELLKGSPNDVKKMFNLCPETDLFQVDNQRMLVGILMNLFPIQSNNPHCTESNCNYRKLSDHFLSSKENGLNVIVNMFLSDLALDHCTMLDFNEEMASFNGLGVGNLNRVWTYQTCTEWGFFQTCEDESCPFFTTPEIGSIDGFLEYCESFGFPKGRDFYEKTISATNQIFGGDLIATENGAFSNILYVNGEVDPWRAASVQESANDGVKVLSVKGASHHFWTHNAKEDDDIHVKKAREDIIRIVDEWIGFDKAAHTLVTNEGYRLYQTIGF